MRKVVVIGGGASGMLSAYASASAGNRVILIEKNEKLGKKLYITGKGRCNVTNSVPVSEFFNNVVTNPKFIYGAINSFSAQNLMDLLSSNGLKLKVERGNRVFPESDKASDVTKTLEKMLISNNVDILLKTEVKEIIAKNDSVFAVKTEQETIFCDSVIVCTGGLSYPLTGSTGDGYTFAKSVGHSIVSVRPSLTGIELKGSDFTLLQGLSLKNVCVKAVLNGKTLYEDFGEMLFTHFGVSGPIILSCSSVINKFNVSEIDLLIDLKPAIDSTVLDARLIREFKDNNTKSIYNTMRSLLPKALIEVVLRRANVSLNKNCSEITFEERASICKTLKNFTFKIKSLRPIDEAIVTSGGVNVKEINPKTMESKLVKNLFFAGEVLDVDAFTGGFNLQLAFSTGYVAGANS